VPERNVFKIPDSLDWDTAASLPVTSLTPYHALKEASLKINEYLVVFGASGSTGMIAVQLAKKMGAKVIAVSRHSWIKDSEFGGADYLISNYNRVADEVKDITEGKMADVVLNSLGVETWENSYASIGINGRWITFGTLSGPDIKLNLQSLYTRQVKLIGSTGGTRRELQEVIDMAANKEIRVKVWKKLKLDKVKEAVEALSAKERDGRILLEIT
jgi:NADPH:quinone reductase-like Zn-dependent oxidoreductase